MVDQEKLQATLTDQALAGDCDLKRAFETVALLEAQLKEMNPNLESISEYAFHIPYLNWTTEDIIFAKCSVLKCSPNCTRYRRKVSLYTERVGELNSVTQQRDDTKKQYDDWRKKRQVYLVFCPLNFKHNHPPNCFLASWLWFSG